MENFKLVKSFEYKGHQCFIVSVHFMPELSHNGYVEVKHNQMEADYNDYNLNVPMELTYQGNSKKYGYSSDRIFIGFDTNHYYDTAITKSLQNVECVCREFVDALENYYETRI